MYYKTLEMFRKADLRSSVICRLYAPQKSKAEWLVDQEISLSTLSLAECWKATMIVEGSFDSKRRADLAILKECQLFCVKIHIFKA